jgi:tight adherence protein C
MAESLFAFLAAGSLTVLVYLVLVGRGSRLEGRLRELSGKTDYDFDPMGQLALQALPRMGAALLPGKEEERTRLQSRLVHAGLYTRQAMPVFLGVKLLLMVVPPLLGLLAGLADLMPTSHGLVYGALLGVCGAIAPNAWLNRRKAERQLNLRRALPDALDVLVICLEGGLGLSAAFKRVAAELSTAHPLLARELRIVEREIQLGRTTGEAMRHFAERTDLEELRTLASVISQTERFGASLVKALRTHADTLREKRLQYAEEMAQKAATKILFPTILFIFPGVFIVILGPAFYQIAEMFENLSR